MQGFRWFLSHTNLYYLGLLVMAIGLPSSNVFMSISTFTIAGNWILERNYKEKLINFWNNKTAVVLASFFLLHVLGLLYTNDFEYALKDLRIKLPLLLLPFLYTSIQPLAPGRMKVLLLVLTGSVVVVTFLGFMAYLGWLGVEVKTPGDLSLFISRIRLSLLICISLFIWAYYFTSFSLVQKLLAVVGTLWLIYFMNLLQSGIGFVVLGAGVLFLLVRFMRKSLQPKLKFALGAILIGFVAACAIYVVHAVNEYYTVLDTADFEKLEHKTPDGNLYQHNKKLGVLENGYYVGLYIAWSELEEGWQARSELPFDGKDAKGQPLSMTLIRYMTSKGLKKDAGGLKALDANEIKLVESGVASIKDLQQSGMRKRIDKIIFELDAYYKGQNPSGNSVTQRLEFWKTASQLIRNNFFFGVGTGDVKQEFAAAYKEGNSLLAMDRRHRSHNQYLTNFVAFGVVGFVWFLLMLVWPFIMKMPQINALYLLFFITITLSFLTEDTLESQAGVTLFAFFNSLFLLVGTSKQQNNLENE